MLIHLSPLFLLNAVKSAVPGVDRNDIHSIATAVPPLPEQHGIVAHVASETAKLDALRSAAEPTIGLLKERRAALIAAAVTGQLDSLALVS
jgi:type I restriction enzyme S subunit